MNALVAEVHAMQFRLRTDAYVGKNAEIYLTVPLHVTGLRESHGDADRVDHARRLHARERAAGEPHAGLSR